MRDDYKAVTVAQLLAHSGGLPTYLRIGPNVAPSLENLGTNPGEQRAEFIKRVLQEEPIVKPGTESRYSNAGYALVGFVAEQRTGRTWESLMRAEVFQPLGMNRAGFGRPRTKERPNEPWLHQWTEQGYEAEAEDRVNALEALAPAGNVHCSIRDFARFAIYELNAARGNNTLLTAATAKRFQELSRWPAAGGRSGPPAKTASSPETKEGRSPKVAKGPKAGKRPGGGNAFFGGSAFISSGCIVWVEQNAAAVVALNGGGGHATIESAFDEIKRTVVNAE
jgi:CubicO group peptidase (beta-lactamase class C family)